MAQFYYDIYFVPCCEPNDVIHFKVLEDDASYYSDGVYQYTGTEPYPNFANPNQNLIPDTCYTVTTTQIQVVNTLNEPPSPALLFKEITGCNDPDYCPICPTNYQLQDCANPNNIKITCTDLSQYLYNVIKLRNCPETCWKVTETPSCVDVKPIDDAIIASYPPQEIISTCTYDLTAVDDSPFIACLDYVIVSINNTGYYFGYSSGFDIEAAINSLDLGVATLIGNDLTIVGENVYGTISYIFRGGCSEVPIPNIIISPICSYQITFDCEACLPTPPVPVIPEAEPRKVRPGYFIKNPCLTTDYVEKVNCTFGNQVYDQMISVRYGINSCCEVDVNKWDIKKQIVDYTLMTIPKEEEHTPRVCYCYSVEMTTGNATFKYISCDGNWTSVSMLQGQIINICSQNKPQLQCTELNIVYTIIPSTVVCQTNDDCE